MRKRGREEMAAAFPSLSSSSFWWNGKGRWMDWCGGEGKQAPFSPILSHPISHETVDFHLPNGISSSLANYASCRIGIGDDPTL